MEQGPTQFDIIILFRVFGSEFLSSLLITHVQNTKAVTASLPQHCNLSTTNNYKTFTHRFPSTYLRYHKNREQLCSSSTLHNVPSIAFVSDQNCHYISGKWQHRYTHNNGRVVEMLTKRLWREKDWREVEHYEDIVQWNKANILKVLVNLKAVNLNLSF